MRGFHYLVWVLQHLEDLGSQGSIASQTYVEANMLQHSLGIVQFSVSISIFTISETKYNLPRP